MKKSIKYITILGLVLFWANGSIASDSMFEYYANSSSENLQEETEEMGSKLRKVFSQDAIGAQQQKIDFSEYFSHLKKTVLYATKLATYNEYEHDLQFAKDKEIFKGLPEEPKNPRKNEPPLDRKEFVHNKYDRMKKNIREEIETYDDLILLSLDTCETLIDNDLSGILDDSNNQSRVTDFMQGDLYKGFQSKRAEFQKGWPGLDSRISAQFSMWGPKPPSLDDPILDPNIVGAI